MWWNRKKEIDEIERKKGGLLNRGKKENDGILRKKEQKERVLTY